MCAERYTHGSEGRKRRRRRFLTRRIDPAAKLLGDGHHRRVQPALCRLCHSTRRGGRSGCMPDVQRRHGKAGTAETSLTDHDPLFRFHRWLANLRILEIEEVKSVPYAPVSHPFVERMIRTIREELLDQVLFWNLLNLERKLTAFQTYYNRYRVHSGIGGRPPEQAPNNGVIAHDVGRDSVDAPLPWLIPAARCRVA